MARFRDCAEMAHLKPTCDRMTYGRKNEEYLADVHLIAKRTMTPEDYKLFRWHFVLGADWTLCAPRLKMDRGTFFNHVYSVQQKLGRAFRETEPYPLFPVAGYFAGTVSLVRAQERAA